MLTKPTEVASLQPLRTEYNDWLFSAALPIWWALGADRTRGGFRDALDHGGQPARPRSRLRVQGRQVYVYATAGKLGWRGPWRAATEHGLDWILTRHSRDDGLFRTLLTIDGEPVDETATLYDQSFVLLALASAASVLPERKAELEAVAERLLAATRKHLGHPVVGFIENEDGKTFQANAQMHLLEAALTWSQVSSDGRWRALADEIGELCCAKFIDPESGALREFYDDQWRPASGDIGDVVEPGHQFEWAWLLLQWHWLSGAPQAPAVAARLFEVGERGVDPARRVAQNILNPALEVRDAAARLWPQTERIKAAHLLASTAEGDQRDAYAAVAEQAALGLQQFLKVDIPGLWRDILRADKSFVEEPAPASSFYHVMAAVAELNHLRIVSPPR